MKMHIIGILNYINILQNSQTKKLYLSILNFVNLTEL